MAIAAHAIACVSCVCAYIAIAIACVVLLLIEVVCLMTCWQPSLFGDQKCVLHNDFDLTFCFDKKTKQHWKLKCFATTNRGWFVPNCAITYFSYIVFRFASFFEVRVMQLRHFLEFSFSTFGHHFSDTWIFVDQQSISFFVFDRFWNVLKIFTFVISHHFRGRTLRLLGFFVPSTELLVQNASLLTPL